MHWLQTVVSLTNHTCSHCQVVTGSKPTFNQTLQFVVTPSARARGDGGDLVLCVWDRYLFKECRARPIRHWHRLNST